MEGDDGKRARSSVQAFGRKVSVDIECCLYINKPVML